MTIKPLNPNKQIVVSNTINEARFKMTKAEQKLFLYCIGVVNNKENVLNTKFEINVKDFAEFLEISKNKRVYEDMIKITGDMASRVIQFTKEDGALHQIPALAEVIYKKGLVTIEVNRNLAPYLIDLKKQFTQFSLSEVLQFKSLYSMRIYQILSQWIYKGNVEYTIEKLRFMLDIEDREYILYSNFKIKVLEVAFKEINKNSLLKYTYKELKTGRKVTSILFTIKEGKKPKKEQIQEFLPSTQLQEEKPKEIKPEINFVMVDYPQDNQKASEMVNRLVGIGFSKQNSQKIVEECGEDYVLFALEKSKVESRSKIDNKAGYFTSIIGTYKEIYKDEKQREDEEKKQSRISQELQEERQRELKAREDKFSAEQEELSRSILEEEPEIFCKAIYKYMQIFIVDMQWGFVYHPDWNENRMTGKTNENLKIAKEIRSRFISCTSLREFRNLIKHDEEWLFKAVFNEPNQFDKNANEYYKSKQNLVKMDKIELPFKI